MAVRGNRADEDVKVEYGDTAEEMPGKMDRSSEEQKLMHTVMENDSQTVEDGRVVMDALNTGVGNFTPDLMFEKLVSNYEEAEELYGETILREVTGYEPSSLERNIRIPEFRRLLKEELAKRIKRLQKDGILDATYGITDKGFLLAALILVKDELDHLLTAGFGRHEQREARDQPSQDVTMRKRRWKDLDIARTIAIAAKRGRKAITADTFRFREQESEGKISIVYCLDASGSMKGKKLALAKRAGVALAYEAMQSGDDVGLVAFGSVVETTIPPSKRFMDLVQALTTIKARYETDLALAIKTAIPLLSGKSKHIVLLTDALHTTSSVEEVLGAAQEAHDLGITISIIGIALDKEGEELSRQIIDRTQGQFYHVQNLQEMDLLILEDYARMKRA